MRKSTLFYFWSLVIGLLLFSCGGPEEEMNFPNSGIDSIDNRCGTMITKPEQKDFERKMNAMLLNSSILVRRHNNVIIVPVVVHVVYNTEEENIPDAHVYSQIDALNRDFRYNNSDKSALPGDFSRLAADLKIEFQLAKLDPKGNPTSGITRTKTDEYEFDSFSEGVKYKKKGGHDVWNPLLYLNIWVCNLEGGLLGYAQFPGGSAKTDGVVIDYTVCGEIGEQIDSVYNKGRSCVHEVGHWLGLYHIWGDDSYFFSFGESCGGSDEIDDTPNQDGPTYGGIKEGEEPSSCGSKDMYPNYMDYTDDAYMGLFTQDQKSRCRKVLRLFKPSIYKQNKKVRKILNG